MNIFRERMSKASALDEYLRLRGASSTVRLARTSVTTMRFGYGGPRKS